MTRLFWLALGWAFLFLGILLMILPIPFGLVFLMLAFVVLVPLSPWFVRRMRGMRARFRLVNSAFSGLTRRVPVPYRRVLRATEPMALRSDRW